MALKLKLHDVRLNSKSSIDPNGKLFSWNGDLYRAISPALAPAYRNLLESNNIQRLFDIGLIETEIVPIDLEGFDLVLKHHRVPFVSYATEWCGSMLKDAALLTLELSLALADLGLELQDAHPWNVLFDGCKPIFIDFGSIVPVRDSHQWRPVGEFYGMFYNPLYLMSQGLAAKARSLIVDSKTQLGRRVHRRDIVFALLNQRNPNRLVKALLSLNKLPKLTRTSERTATIFQLQDRISTLSIPLEKTAWSDYSSDEVDLTKQGDWIIKRQSALNAISRCHPKTVLDIGSNTGWFSKLASILGSQVVAFDVDETSINKLYLNKKTRDLRILPLAMDFRHPTPAYGRGLHCEPAADRFRCEMVLALALVHHLVFKQKLQFDEIVRKLSLFTEKWLLVEFIPREDKYVSKWYNEDFSWYSTDGFVRALRVHYSKVETLPSNPEPRLLFLCER